MLRLEVCEVYFYEYHEYNSCYHIKSDGYYVCRLIGKKTAPDLQKNIVILLSMWRKLCNVCRSTTFKRHYSLAMYPTLLSYFCCTKPPFSLLCQLTFSN